MHELVKCMNLLAQHLLIINIIANWFNILSIKNKLTTSICYHLEDDVNYTSTTDLTSTTTEGQPYDIIYLLIFKIVQLAIGFLLIVIIGSASIYVFYKKVAIYSSSYPTTQSTDSKRKIGKISPILWLTEVTVRFK